MDTRLIIQTLESVSVIPASEDELAILLNFLNWIRESEFSEYLVKKTQNRGAVDVAVTTRKRFIYRS